MTPTKLLIGQALVVFAIVTGGVWATTQWTAAMLGYQAGLGEPWFELLRWPVYHPWRLFEWWYAYEAYAPDLFRRAGMFAAASGLAGTVVAVIGPLWRARQNRFVTPYGSSPRANRKEAERDGLFEPGGRVLRRPDGPHTPHYGPGHGLAP